MKLLIYTMLIIPLVVLAQSGGIGGIPRVEKYVAPPLETGTWRDSGAGMSPVSKLDACSAARKDGNSKIDLQSFKLQRDAHRIIKGSTMAECSCDGPAAAGWHKCTVDIAITHTNI